MIKILLFQSFKINKCKYHFEICLLRNATIESYLFLFAMSIGVSKIILFIKYHKFMMFGM